MSPTYEVPPRAAREYRKLERTQQDAFDAARRELVAALRHGGLERAPVRLRIKRVQGHPGVWELTWAPDGRATFAFGAQPRPGEAHIVWRRIGDHSILRSP